jgi:hypothetical protein
MLVQGVPDKGPAQCEQCHDDSSNDVVPNNCRTGGRTQDKRRNDEPNAKYYVGPAPFSLCGTGGSKESNETDQYADDNVVRPHVAELTESHYHEWRNNQPDAYQDVNHTDSCIGLLASGFWIS